MKEEEKKIQLYVCHCLSPIDVLLLFFIRGSFLVCHLPKQTNRTCKRNKAETCYSKVTEKEDQEEFFCLLVEVNWFHI